MAVYLFRKQRVWVQIPSEAPMLFLALLLNTSDPVMDAVARREAAGIYMAPIRRGLGTAPPVAREQSHPKDAKKHKVVKPSKRHSRSKA